MGPKWRQKLFGNKTFEAFPLQCETSADGLSKGLCDALLVTGTCDCKGGDKTMLLKTRLNQLKSCEQKQFQVQLYI